MTRVPIAWARELTGVALFFLNSFDYLGRILISVSNMLCCGWMCAFALGRNLWSAYSMFTLLSI